ncbi:MAG: hypothetical protein JXP73_09870 [Deltaproteobacteria bacterium]|jgi:hypothetical protein|nr:hypothetical protein [Deltaproteobacteria bacterium]
MQKLIRALGVFLVLFVLVVYTRDCRVSFSRWKHCGGDPAQPGFLGDWVDFDWKLAGLFTDVLYVDGEPAARLVKYDFGLSGDVMEIASLDGTKRARYCGK